MIERNASHHAKLYRHFPGLKQRPQLPQSLNNSKLRIYSLDQQPESERCRPATVGVTTTSHVLLAPEPPGQHTC